MPRKLSRLLAVSFVAVALSTIANPANAELYTAWAGKKHPTEKNFYSRFYYGLGSSTAQARGKALNACGTRCKILKIEKGCVSFRLKTSGKVLHPKGC